MEENGVNTTEMDDAWEAALREQRDAEAGVTPTQAQEDEKSPSHPVQQREQRLGDALAPSPGTATVGLELLLSIPVEVSVRLGETKLVVNDLMQLGQGSIVELDKLAGADLDLMINDVVMGRGEVVVVNDRFGLRVTEIVSPEDRIKGLG
ncbi:MAG: flagellar motor switch protein FliN [Deltaproteobacteria bacterium]|nr:flagellar motor switch protein FliN [Deltaproteobacteria bacterium]